MLCKRSIEKFKVQWKHIGLEEAMWEMVDSIKANYPSFLLVNASVYMIVNIV